MVIAASICSMMFTLFQYAASKISSQSDLTHEHPMVDYTPPSYITLLFTDLGILTPSAVSDELIKLYLWSVYLVQLLCEHCINIWSSVSIEDTSLVKIKIFRKMLARWILSESTLVLMICMYTCIASCVKHTYGYTSGCWCVCGRMHDCIMVLFVSSLNCYWFYVALRPNSTGRLDSLMIACYCRYTSLNVQSWNHHGRCLSPCMLAWPR